MHTVLIQGAVPKELKADLEAQVLAYAKANPAQVTADMSLTTKDAAGKKVVVEGRYGRHDGIFQLVFSVGTIVGGAPVTKRAKAGSRPRDHRTGAKRNAERSMSTSLPTDPDGMLKYALSNKMLKEEKNGSFTMAGGKTFPNRAAILAHFGRAAGAIADSSKADALVGQAPPKPAAKKKAAPKKAAKKSAPVKKSATKAPAKKAAKSRR